MHVGQLPPPPELLLLPLLPPLPPPLLLVLPPLLDEPLDPPELPPLDELLLLDAESVEASEPPVLVVLPPQWVTVATAKSAPTGAVHCKKVRMGSPSSRG